MAALQRLEAIDAEVEAEEREAGAKLAAGLAACEAQLARVAEEAARLQVSSTGPAVFACYVSVPRQRRARRACYSLAAGCSNLVAIARSNSCPVGLLAGRAGRSGGALAGAGGPGGGAGRGGGGGGSRGRGGGRWGHAPAAGCTQRGGGQ